MYTRKLMLFVVMAALECCTVRLWDYRESRQQRVLRFRNETGHAVMWFDLRGSKSAAAYRKTLADLQAASVRYEVRYGKRGPGVDLR